MVAMVTNMVSGIKETMKETPKACIPLCLFGPVWGSKCNRSFRGNISNYFFTNKSSRYRCICKKCLHNHLTVHPMYHVLIRNPYRTLFDSGPGLIPRSWIMTRHVSCISSPGVVHNFSKAVGV